MTIEGPHQDQPILFAGKALAEADRAMILVHGRGSTAQSILSLVPDIDTGDFTYLAPQAAGGTWYPYSFLAPIEQNEPGISSGIRLLADRVEHLASAGIPPGRVILLGFSQGACLTLEFAARYARRYGGVVGLSGGLIGPDGTDRNYPGTLERTPVFLGCSDIDSHVPKPRVEHTAEVLSLLGAQVTLRLYPGMGHTVNQDELQHVRQMMSLPVDGDTSTNAKT